MTATIETRIVDTHHHDAFDLTRALPAGLQAVFLKATEGRDWKDPLFAQRFADAKNAGVLVGAYHFASGSAPGATQADFFIARVREVAGCAMGDVLLVLDWEKNDGKAGDMSVANAEQFVTRVRDVTGRWPVLYSFTSYLQSKLPGRSAVLARCPLWQAQYGERPSAPASPTWDRIALWQYTNGGAGPRDTARFPRSFPGFGGCDRSAFDGDASALRAWWQSAGR